MDIRFDDTIQLTVNDKKYSIPKSILTTAFEYFSIIDDKRFSDDINTTVINIDTVIDFNIILNIITWNYYGKVYDKIKNFTPDEFVEIICTLIYFGSKNNTITNLIKQYDETNSLPYKQLYEINLEKHDINNGLKAPIIKNIIEHIHNSTGVINIPLDILDVIKLFQMQFNGDDLNKISNEIRDHIIYIWNQIDYGYSGSITYQIRTQIYTDGLLWPESHYKFEETMRKVLGKIGSSIQFTYKQFREKDIYYDVEFIMDNIITYNYHRVVNVPVIDMLSRHMLRRLLNIPLEPITYRFKGNEPLN